MHFTENTGFCAGVSLAPRIRSDSTNKIAVSAVLLDNIQQTGAKMAPSGVSPKKETNRGRGTSKLSLKEIHAPDVD
jgi:hypothetical protein